MSTIPPLTEADLPALYSTYYPRRDVNYQDIDAEAAAVARPMAGFRRWLAGTDNQGHYSAKAGDRVLDIGSGSCVSLLELQRMGNKAWGIETDPNVAAIAAHFGINVHIGSIHDTPFPGESFDLITLNQVIEHIPEPLSLLSAIHPRLMNEGRVILAFPNGRSLYRRIFGGRWINWHIPYHQHFYNKQSFKLLASKAGFEVAEVRTVTPNLWTAIQLRMLGPPPPVGTPAKEWSSNNASEDTPKRRSSAIIRVLARVVTLGFALLNRVVDAIGVGDSLIVTLRKKP